MKKMLLPLVFAVLAGVASSTAATFVNAKKAFALHTAFVADSLVKQIKDSTAAADSVKTEVKKHEAERTVAESPLTPADSIRAAHNEPTTLTTATKGLPNAVDPGHAAPTAAHDTPVSAAHAVVATPKSTSDEKAAAGKVNSARAIDATKSAVATRVAPAATASRAPDAIEGALPEGRIAKIFSGMQSKDAAKILEQMNDSDVRVILGRMSDKQAAAILVAFPAARAAAISKGDSKTAAGNVAGKSDSNKTAKSDSTKTQKPAGDHK